MMNSKAVALAMLVLSACADSDDDELFDLDQDAAAQDGKADGLGGIVRLEAATPADVQAEMTSYWGTELRECFEAYRLKFDPNATMVTKAAAAKFSLVDNSLSASAPCAQSHTLRTLVEGVLDANQLTEATTEQLLEEFPAWVEPQLEAASVDGFVEPKQLDSTWYYDLMRTRDANARAREKNPTGVSLAAIRDAWDDVRDTTTLDRAYLNPVTFPDGTLDGDLMFRYLRAAFPLRGLSYQSNGRTAIDEFNEAGEGPEGDPAFTPIATALKKSSIRKRFFFARSGEWSSNVLIVVDNRGQAWGMQMGYSE